MPNGAGVKKQTFIEADDTTYRSLTYDFLHEIYDSINSSRVCDLQQKQSCEERFQRLERKWAWLTGALVFFAATPSILLVILKFTEVI